MTPLGWLFLACSLTLVCTLTLWCFYKVLSIREEPPESWDVQRSGAPPDAVGQSQGNASGAIDTGRGDQLDCT